MHCWELSYFSFEWKGATTSVLKALALYFENGISLGKLNPEIKFQSRFFKPNKFLNPLIKPHNFAGGNLGWVFEDTVSCPIGRRQ